ncbi:hypothetical protein [Rhodosalinus sediminis]|uniref:hypothetical protein n=1 Tax=Rhodosalinus sediminis TaxID=1940533 RepID=UPI0011C04DC7|nr:hypothetical protein [Rhodosalinus sediminis]
MNAMTTKMKAETRMQVQTLRNTLEELHAQRSAWEEGTYKRSNDELYAILEECGRIFAELRESKARARVFNAAIDEMGVTFNTRTSMALKIVRVVFGQQTRREYAYANVLKVWFNEADDRQTVRNFLIERGGIENVRRTSNRNSTQKLKTEDYRSFATDTLQAAAGFGTFSLQDSMLHDENNDTDYAVALVRCDSNGNGSVVYSSNKHTLVKNALAVIGKELDERARSASSKENLEEEKKRRQENINAFVARELGVTDAA